MGTPIQLTIEKKKRILFVRDGYKAYFPKSRQGPNTCKNLRDADYGKFNGKPLRQITSPELSRLVYVSLMNDPLEEIKLKLGNNYSFTNNLESIVMAISSGIVGNTLSLWTPKSILVIDFPSDELVEQLNKNEQSVLAKIAKQYKDRLGKREELGVVYSDDGKVRFAPLSKIIFERQKLRKFAINPANIVFAGSAEDAELNAKSAGEYRTWPYFSKVTYEGFAVSNPVLGSFGLDNEFRLDLFDISHPEGKYRYSFGALDFDRAESLEAKAA